MQAFCSQGKRTLALRAYERCRAVLREEFGVKPDVATRRLAVSLGLIEPNKKYAVAAQLPDPRQQAGNPRVMLLPPIVVDDHAATRRVASALVEDVICGLARFNSFVVIAPHTGFCLVRDGADLATIRSHEIAYVVGMAVAPPKQRIAVNIPSY